MKTAEDALKELIRRIDDAKVASRDPSALTKRGGEYRIGLSQAINLAHDVIAELTEETESYASHPSPVMSADEYVLNNGMGTATQYSSGAIHSLGEFPAENKMSAEQVEELGYYYPLFKFFSDEHGLTLLDSQLQDVIHECKKFIEPTSPSVKAGGWVSVDDGLPLTGKRVLCITTSGFISVGYNYRDVWEMNDCGESFASRGYTVTHWHPIPTPPNVNNK